MTTRVRSPRITALVLALAGCPTGCTGSGAREMLDTARLEEVRDNPENAAGIYRAIVEQYPGSSPAEAARARLDGLAR